MSECVTISYSDAFKSPHSDCVIIFRCHFKSVSGCINVKNIEILNIQRTTFEEIVGCVSLSVEDVDEVGITKACFDRCEFVDEKYGEGTVSRVSRTKVLSVIEASFFGCCTAFELNQNRYIAYFSSSDLTLVQSNSSFNRAMRGTGALVEKSIIKNYSHCIYASGFCRGVSVYVHTPLQPTTVENLLFVNNINFDENDPLQSIFVIAAGVNDVNIMNSYFVDNVAYVIFRTLDTNHRIISSKNVFSIPYSGIKNLGNVVMREEENTFITQLARSQPAGFDHLFACAIYDVKTKRKGARFNPIQYIAFFQTLLE